MELFVIRGRLTVAYLKRKFCHQTLLMLFSSAINAVRPKFYPKIYISSASNLILHRNLLESFGRYFSSNRSFEIGRSFFVNPPFISRKLWGILYKYHRRLDNTSLWRAPDPPVIPKCWNQSLTLRNNEWEERRTWEDTSWRGSFTRGTQATVFATPHHTRASRDAVR